MRSGIRNATGFHIRGLSKTGIKEGLVTFVTIAAAIGSAQFRSAAVPFCCRSLLTREVILGG